MLHRTMALMGVAAVLACTAVLRADTGEYVERFTFRAANAPEDALAKDGRLQLVIKRWSNDEERQLTAQHVEEPDNLLGAFRTIGPIGYLQWPGGLEYTVRYARRVERADGGADIVLVAERPLWVWWTQEAWSGDRPFTVVHLRVDKDGVGEGRVAFAADSAIKSDPTTGVTIADLNKAPLLTDVRRDS